MHFMLMGGMIKTLWHTLFLKKNMIVHGSYSSYIVLKSGHSEISTK